MPRRAVDFEQELLLFSIAFLRFHFISFWRRTRHTSPQGQQA